jgi:hypothetical protein
LFPSNNGFLYFSSSMLNKVPIQHVLSFLLPRTSWLFLYPLVFNHVRIYGMLNKMSKWVNEFTSCPTSLYQLACSLLCVWAHNLM